MKKEIIIEGERFRVKIQPGDPITRCAVSVYRMDGTSIDLYGIGVRKAADPYDLETGCRMALKSALKELAPSSKTMIWNEYFKHFPFSARPIEAQKLADYGRHIIRKIEAQGVHALNEIPISLIERCMEAVIMQEQRANEKDKLLSRIRRSIKRAHKQSMETVVYEEKPE